jgi:membrane-associated phospholipid phosphatase
MSRDCKLKAGIILAVLCANILLIVALDLRFPPGDAVRPILITALLLGFAIFYHRVRNVPEFVWTATAMAQLVLFSSCYTVLMYSIAATARPLVDGSLVQVDRWIGFEVPQVMAWANAYPTVRDSLQLVYNTLLPQTALVVIVLGFLKERRPLETFMLRFMLATLLTAVVFYAYPADGPFSAYDYAANQSQTRYLEHFHAMRAGERTLVTWRGAEGLITFPSFHTTWAILLALALRRRPIMFALSAVLNCAVIIDTLTTGWHYVSDVLGGVVVGGIVIALAHCLSWWLYPATADGPQEQDAAGSVRAGVLSPSGAS